MRIKLLLFLILSIGAFFRFYNLNWSGRVVWHPDERNMALAIEQMRFPLELKKIPSCFFSSSPPTAPNSRLPTTNYQLQTGSCNLNPHFFAYGGFPLYLGFASGLLTETLIRGQRQTSIDFQTATIFLRIFSALSSLLTLFIVFLIVKNLLSEKEALLAVFLTTFTPGLIQAAHFGTTESLLGLFLLLTTYLPLLFYQTGKDRYLFSASLVLGLTLATKISVLPLFAGPLISVILLTFKGGSSLIRSGFDFAKRVLILLTTVTVTLVLAAPFNLLAFSEFKGIFNYDIPVAVGKLPVFYTRQFIDTFPFLFQWEKILPSTLGFFLTLFGTFSFLVFIYLSFREFKKNQASRLIILISFLAFFIANSIYFTKWTRYVLPTFPFFAIFSSFAVAKIKNQFLKRPLIAVLILSTLIQGLAFFRIYRAPDSRFTASRWIYENVPSGETVLSETANVSDVPILPDLKAPAGYFLSQEIFNFYDLDQNRDLQAKLIQDLKKSDYIFIPSRRIFKNHQRLKNDYPILNRYYESLFGGKLGFTEIAEFTSYPNLSILNYQLSINDEDAEETFTVFDHPVVRIYQKKKQLTEFEYRNLLGIQKVKI